MGANVTGDEIQALAEAHMDAFTEALHLNHWKIGIVVTDQDPAVDGNAADCKALPDYDSATIHLYATNLVKAGERQVLDALRHELLHIVLSPYDLMEEAARRSFPSGNSSGLRVFERVTSFAAEQTVINLQRVLGDIEDWTAATLAAYAAANPPLPALLEVVNFEPPVAVTPPVTLLDVV